MIALWAAAIAVETLFAPLQPGGSLPGGWTWAATRHRPDGGAELILAGPGGAAATLVVAPRREGGSYAKSARHDLFFQGGNVPSALKPALDALAGRMLANDGGKAAAEKERRGPPGWLLNWASRLALLLCLAGLALGLAEARRVGPSPAGPSAAGPGAPRLPRQVRLDLYALGALFAGGLAWRATFAPAAFLHENFYAGYLLSATADAPAPQAYGNGWFVLVHDLRAFFGPSPAVVFGFTLVLGALGPPALAALAFVLCGSRRVALCAGGLYAVWPAHVRYSFSEDMYVALTPFALAGLALLAARARKEAGLWAALGGAGGLALAMTMRPVEMVLPLLALCAALAVGGRAALQDRALWLAAALIALITAPNVWNLAAREERTVFAAVAAWDHALHNLRAGTLFFDPERTPRALWALLAVGLPVALWRHRPLAFTALAGTLGLGYLYLGIALWPSAARLQLSYQPFLALLAAAGAAAVLGLVRRAGRVTAGAAAGGLLAAVALPALPSVRATGDQQAEWDFLARAARWVPAGTIVALDATESAPLLPSLTTGALAAAGRPGVLAPLTFALAPTAPEGLLYYRGLGCALRHVDQPERPMHPLCARVEQAWMLQPLETTRVAARPYTGYTRYPDGTSEVEIGFYRLRRPPEGAR